jgi:hypothetical protein
LPSRVEKALGLVGFALLVALALLACRQVAARYTARYLEQQAGAIETALEAGRTPWQWSPRSRHDLVAQRAFGNAQITTAMNGLRLTSRDGQPFELGWPIDRGLDLAHWPVLAPTRAPGTPVLLSIVWSAEGRPSCVSKPITWADPVARIDLRTLSWQATPAEDCTLPARADMLRLRITASTGSELVLRHVALERPQAVAQPGVSRAVLLDPARWPRQRAALAASAEPSPLLQTPAGASAEQMLAWRDRVLALRPAARVVPAGPRPGAAAAIVPVAAEWMALAGYLCGLAWLARRPAGAAITLAMALAGPLWVIAGLRWGLHASVPAAVAFAAGTSFAAWTSWRQRSHPWHWIGSWHSWSWWLPLALVPVAGGLCILAGNAWTPPTTGRALTYLGWAGFQQWLILAFILPRFERLLPATRWAVLAAATTFAALHTPNGALMQLCFAAELWWAWCFIRSRSVLPVALAHAACALLVGAGLVGQGLRSLEVSARFFF